MIYSGNDLYLYRITKKKKVKLVSKLNYVSHDVNTDEIFINMRNPNIKLKYNAVYYIGRVDNNGEIWVRAIKQKCFSKGFKQISIPSQEDFSIIMTYLGSKHLDVELPVIKQVVYTKPYTTVIWTDGVKTKVKSSDDKNDIYVAIAKRYFKDQSMKCKNPSNNSPKKRVKELIEKAQRDDQNTHKDIHDE